MDHFTIKDIENLCGIKAHTLRIWEQRYQLFIPRRKESQHRIYDCDDLKALLRISFLYHNGYKISKIAGLSPEQIQQEVAGIQPQPCNYEIFVHQLIEASIQFDKENFEKIVNALVLRIGLEKSILHIFYPFLQRIGLLWITNHVIPAQEHFSSHIIKKKIICATDGFEISPNRKYNIIIFSPSGEMHEIPLLVVNYLFRKQGIGTTYFGVNVSVETLLYYSRQHSISHFYSHLITHLDSSGVDYFICSLCKEFPDKPVIISGPASSCIRIHPANLSQLHSLEEVINFAHSLREKQEKSI
jgi:MerR family transcriptional regulator, light-induced transcriptional regulator